MGRIAGAGSGAGARRAAKIGSRTSGVCLGTMASGLRHGRGAGRAGGGGSGAGAAAAVEGTGTDGRVETGTGPWREIVQPAGADARVVVAVRAVLAVEGGEICLTHQDAGRLGTVRQSGHGQRAAIAAARFGGVAGSFQHQREVVEGGGQVGVVWTEQRGLRLQQLSK